MVLAPVPHARIAANSQVIASDLRLANLRIAMMTTQGTYCFEIIRAFCRSTPVDKRREGESCPKKVNESFTESLHNARI